MSHRGRTGPYQYHLDSFLSHVDQLQAYNETKLWNEDC